MHKVRYVLVNYWVKDREKVVAYALEASNKITRYALSI